MKYCPKCGNELSESDIFCSKCGTEQSDVSAVSCISVSESEKKPEEKKPKKPIFKSLIQLLGSKSFWSKKTIILISSFIIALFLIIFVCTIANNAKHNKTPQPDPQPQPQSSTPFSETKVTINPNSIKVTFEQVFNIAKLNVLTIPYSGIIDWTVNGENVGNVKFDGTVKIGIDFDKIEISEIQDGKVNIKIPPVKITYNETDKSSFVLLFSSSKMKKTYNKDSYTSDLYKMCSKKMISDIEQNPDIMNQARDYVKQFIKGLTDPVAENLDIKIDIEVTR